MAVFTTDSPTNPLQPWDTAETAVFRNYAVNTKLHYSLLYVAIYSILFCSIGLLFMLKKKQGYEFCLTTPMVFMDMALLRFILLPFLVIVNGSQLRFRPNGTFKILQIADMHYANGERTKCKDVTPAEAPFCSDLNTTSFVRRLIAEQNPDLVVFTGDNIDFDAVDAAKSMEEAFAPVLDSQTPWAAVLGNHDQESSMSRQEVMSYINGMKHSLSRSQPDGTHSIYGWGNYHLQINGPSMSNSENTSLLNLYFLDSGDYSKISGVGGYDWIRPNQQAWFLNLSSVLKKSSDHGVPGLAYFHIPLPEFKDVHAKACDVVGQQQEDVCSASVNSGFFTSLAEAADVKAVFVGHDHVNDFCGKFLGFYLCYAGGTGYHAYGKVGWSRRARVVLASLGHQDAVVEEIKTWKQLDGSKHSIKDIQVLWKKEASSCPYQPSLSTIECVWSNIGWLIVTIVIGGSIAGLAYFYIKHVKKIYIPVDTKSDQI